MLKQKLKITWEKWSKMLKSATLLTIILAAIAVSYGYYLVEKIGDEYNHAQSTIAQSATPEETQEPEVILSPKTANTPAVSSADTVQSNETDMVSTAQTGNAHPSESSAKLETTTEPEKIVQGQVRTIHYEPTDRAEYTNIAPCTITAVYEYGYGYDPVYKDIRFHNCAFYQADDSFPVFAVADGVIEDITDNDGTMILTIRHEWGLSEYTGVQAYSVKIGQSVIAGEEIATATELSYKLLCEK